MDDSKFIDSLGGTGNVAALCGLEKSAVSQWRKRGIPRPWMLFLKQTKPKRAKESK